MQYNQNKKHEQYYAYTFIADKEESIFLSLARFPLEHHDARQRYIINCKNIIFPKKGDYAIETYVSKELLDLEDKNTYYINKQTLTFHHQEYEIQSITDGNDSPYNLYSLQIDDDYQNISFLTNSNKNSEIITIQVKSSDKIKLVKGYENTIEYDENENKSLTKNVKITYKK